MRRKRFISLLCCSVLAPPVKAFFLGHVFNFKDYYLNNRELPLADVFKAPSRRNLELAL